jgi:hypothetical protein
MMMQRVDATNQPETRRDQHLVAPIISHANTHRAILLEHAILLTARVTATIRVNHTITRPFSEDYLKKRFLASLAVVS